MRLAPLAVASAASGAVLAGLLGGAVTSLIWIVQRPEGAARAVRWGMLHGILIGAAGLLMGVVAGLVATTLAGRLNTWRTAAVLGASIGALFGAALGATLWQEASGKPVAIASLVAQAASGAAIAMVARSRTLVT